MTGSPTTDGQSQTSSSIREREGLFRLEAELHAQLRHVKDVRKALIHGLRATQETIGAAEAALVTRKPGRDHIDSLFRIPRDSEWDFALFGDYLDRRRPSIPDGLLLAPIRRRRRNWAVLALRDPRPGFQILYRPAVFSIAEILSGVIESIDRNRIREIRHRIQVEIANGHDPKNLMYNILQGLRSLTRYDHSASLYVQDTEGLRLMAEQIAFEKARSPRIGHIVPLDDDLDSALTGEARVLHRTDSGNGDAGWSDAIGEVLETRQLGRREAPSEASMIYAPIRTPDRLLGVIKISARRSGALGEHEAELVRDFVPLASLALRFSRETESLSHKVLEAERRSAVANVVRGVAHDVNNALGSMLPLVQQMREDVRAERIEADEFGLDLDSLETSIGTCRRIFGAMLTIAQGSTQIIGPVNLRRAIEQPLNMLEVGLRSHSIRLEVDLPPELPAVRGSQGRITQLFLNLLSNARDAMPRGGDLAVRAQLGEKTVRVHVVDSGGGIPPEIRDRVFDPFFTTKTDGTGLGLSICRSIVFEAGGEIAVESAEPTGTCMIVTLPTAASAGNET